VNLIFDIETDGIEATKVHCIVAREIHSSSTHQFGPDCLDAAVAFLSRAKTLIGHNICGYDMPVLRRLLGFRASPVLYDTLILSRLCWPDVQQDDWARTSSGFPKDLVGRHSLKAWGYRLGLRKDDWGETTDWQEYSSEMLDYCTRDTEVTLELWRAILDEKPAKMSVDIEHRFSSIIKQMEEAGFGFDKAKAEGLACVLQGRREELRQQLVDCFPPTTVVMKTKTKIIPFNPSSRQDIAKGLAKLHGWKAKDFTPDGKPKVDESVLSSLAYPEAKLLLEYLMVVKRLGQLAEGKEAWMTLVKPDGRIHGRVNTNGAVTGRCTHSNPNMAQVPSVRSTYGKESRDLFIPRKGWVLVGADASGLELRCLAHYMAQWDGGAYAKEILDGDIHTANQKAAGLDTRDQAKLFIYAFLYGAGDEKVGTIVGGGTKEGKALKKQFLARTPALKMLRERVQHAAKSRGFLVGIDGRKLPVRSAHAALNLLLQSAGAVAMKQATINLYEELESANITWGRDWRLVAHIHDEMQIECDPGLASEVGITAVAAIGKAGEQLGFRCRLDGEWRSGRSWAETH
jgi:DNA polymerase I